MPDCLHCWHVSVEPGCLYWWHVLHVGGCVCNKLAASNQTPPLPPHPHTHTHAGSYSSSSPSAKSLSGYFAALAPLFSAIPPYSQDALDLLQGLKQGGLDLTSGAAVNTEVLAYNLPVQYGALLAMACIHAVGGWVS